MASESEPRLENLVTTGWPDRIREVSLSIGRDTGKAMEWTERSSTPANRTIGTGLATYCGQGSPLTQVAWLAYKTDFDPEDLAQVEEFYDGRAGRWEYVATPYSSPNLVSEVMARGWTEIQYENVMGLDLSTFAETRTEGVEIEIVQDRDRPAWADLATQGFFGDTVPPGFENLSDIIVHTENMVGFVAKVGGVPAGAASLMVGDRTVYLGGASTLPEFRGKGVQTALLNHRLAHAVGLGADLALCECLVGTQSQRNQERSGFRVVYTKMVLTKPA